MSVADFPRFSPDTTSLLKKHLTPELFTRLEGLCTPHRYTLADTIRSGIENQDSALGVYAGDHASYQLFAELFDPIIAEYHGFQRTQRHSGGLSAACLDGIQGVADDAIISTRIRVARNLSGLPLGPALSRDQRLKIEKQLVRALADLTGELAGTYRPLTHMTEAERCQLVANHLLFKEGDRFLEAAGLNRDWPEGRGFFHNAERTLLAWVNEEDQLRLISMQQGGDLREVFARLAKAHRQLEKRLRFLVDERLGYISSCPSNLGTALRASVHIRLPGLSRRPELLSVLCQDHQLQLRGLHGEHTTAASAIYDISNRRRLGLTENDCMRDLCGGVAALIEAERSTVR